MALPMDDEQDPNADEQAAPGDPEAANYSNVGDMEENDDGSTTINMESLAPAADEGGFYDNLVFTVDATELSGIALDLIQKIEYDKQSRSKRDKMYAEGIRRTGLGDDAPGGAQFLGASRVVHPMLTQATVEFESRVIKELMPASGPVKMFVAGDEVPKSRWAKAERKAKFMNWQLRYSIVEFRPELEKILTQSPLGGVAYQRWIWESKLRRPATGAVTSDKVLLPFAANSFYTAERITFVDDITQLEYKERVRTGLYVDADLTPSSMAPDPTKVAAAQAKIEGKESATSMNEDGVRRIYEVNTYLEGVSGEEDYPLPYMVSIDETSRKVLSIVRNWEQDDKKYQRMHWLVEWPFIPWDGAYPIGFMHMIGSLSGAATGALRALLDSAHVNNIATAAMLKGSGLGGQSKTLKVGETTEIDAGIGSDDVRKRIMQMTYNPPSEVLLQLLEFLVQSGEGMVRVAMDKLAQDNPNMPVGTMYAAIEQGLNVVGAIIGRYYYSMEQTLGVLHRINRMYITDDDIRDETGTMLARRTDFQGPLDCIPVADPATPSDAHRHAKIQAVSARAAQVPQLYNMPNVERMFLKKLLNLPDEEIDELLTPVPKPQQMNAVNENAAAMLGRPVTAYPQQDHMAHIQTHVSFMESPFFGQLQNVAPKLVPIIVQHLVEHLSFWYVTHVFDHAKAALGGRDPSDYMKLRDHEVSAEIDKTLAMVSMDVLKMDTKELAGLPPVIQKAMQFISSMQDANTPIDPSQVQRERNQIQDKKNQSDANLKQQDLQQRAQASNMRLAVDNTTNQIRARNEQMRDDTSRELAEADRLAESARLQMKEQGESRRAQEANATKLEANTDDNMTALSIAKTEMLNDENTDLSTGSGINPGAGTNQ